MTFKTERQFQEATAELLKRLGWLAWHTPNERRSKKEAISLSRQGVTAGVSDWFIAEAHTTGFGVCIELKTASGRVSEAQARFLEQAKARGCLTAVCRSWEEFTAVLRQVQPANGRRMP